MKKLQLIAFVLLLVLSGCTKKEGLTYENFIGRWDITALYLNGGSTNMLAMAGLFEPCLKSKSTLEFTERMTFELKTQCDWMADSGTYSLMGENGETIEAVGEQGTQYFTFSNGQLQMILEKGDYRFEMRFEKQQYKSEYRIDVILLDDNNVKLSAPIGYDTLYYVKHMERLDITAAKLDGYELLSEEDITLESVTSDEEVEFIYKLTL